MSKCRRSYFLEGLLFRYLCTCDFDEKKKQTNIYIHASRYTYKHFSICYDSKREFGGATHPENL